MRWILALTAGMAIQGACGPKKVEKPPPPPLGWHADELWPGSCWYPPDYDALEASGGVAARRLARQQALEAMTAQWRGQRDDGIHFDERVVSDVEAALLGFPAEIEETSRRNLGFCKQAMGAGGGTGQWAEWLGGLADGIMAGKCMQPLTYTLFDYLDIGTGWQIPVPMCAGDVALISATVADRYRIQDDGPWINAGGDPDHPTSGMSGFPCNREGCFAGMLIGRFVTQAGVETVFPIGTEARWTAPEAGTLTVRINDATFVDNTWFKSGGVVDHTGITVEPGS